MGWQATWRPAIALTTGLAVVAGCGDALKHTELEPEGPPEVLQVLALERGEGEPRIAFGDHPQVDPEHDDHAVDAAIAGTEQRVRVVFDELLRGNDLEEVLCADGSWSRVPPGTERADVARCAGRDLGDCTAVCVGVGIMDADGDLFFDDTRLIAGVAALVCDGVEIAADPDASFYQPSGNQLVPAGPLGLGGLGPALVLAPSEPLPTSSRCRLVLAEAVVDRDGVRPCADAGQGCTPGDMTAIDFGVEPLLALAADPADGATGVATDIRATIALNVAVDPATLAAVTATTGGVPVALEVTAAGEVVTVDFGGALESGTTYELTLGTGVTDLYGGALPSPVTLTFTTAEEAP